MQKQIAALLVDILGDALFTVPAANGDGSLIGQPSSGANEVTSKSPSVSSSSSDAMDAVLALDTIQDAQPRDGRPHSSTEQFKNIELHRVWSHLTPAMLVNKFIISVRP